MTPKHHVLPEPPTPSAPSPVRPSRPHHHREHGDEMFGVTTEVKHEHVDVNALPRIPTWVMLVIILLNVALFGAVFLLGYIPYRAKQAALAAETQRQREQLPVVDVVKPNPQPAVTEFMLPGDVRAFQETALYPRTSGYLKSLYVDIGDTVKSGQLLAEIDAPEVDAQVGRASATLEQAQADEIKAETDLSLAQATLERYESFAKEGGVTKQQLDEKRSAVAQAKAIVASSKANVIVAQSEISRMAKMQEFERVSAPFNGRVTARHYDVGTLLSAANTGPGNELIRIADTAIMRVFVDVPQAYVGMLHENQAATLEVRNYNGRTFTGHVVRTTGEVDPTTRTVRYEIHFPNADGKLFPGMYGQVRFQIKQERPTVTVPSSSIGFTSTGATVGVVKDDVVQFVKVNIGRDFGPTVELIDGVTAADTVVSNPGERLHDGVKVRIKAPAPAADKKS
jgi:RND family efflux transporter MFP subunit